MTVRSQRNEYYKLKENIERTKQTIYFLQKCKKTRVYPKFIKIHIGIRNSRTRKVVNEAKKVWLKLEISYLYSNITAWEKRIYTIHLFLAKHCSNNLMHELWIEEERMMREVIEHMKTEMRKTQKEKYSKWKADQHRVRHREHSLKPEFIDKFVVNLSSVTLKDDELELLNKGLNFILPPKTLPAEDICVDIMSSVRYKNAVIKDDIEINALSIMREAIDNHAPNESVVKAHKVVSSLRKKDLIIAKADKSNNVIVMDTSYYERIVMKVIRDGPYEEMEHNPLSDMIASVEAVLEKHKFVICENPIRELRLWKVSNPQVPCLYALLKLHKEKDIDGDYKARPVVCNTNAPSEKIAKKLSAIFNNLPPPEGKSVKNGTTFANIMNGTRINRSEKMGSYDVTALYPSVPIEPTMEFLNEWLVKCGVDSDMRASYVEMTLVCMKQNIFQFRGKFYLQTDGSAIGNSLSSFVAEVFMCRFEISLAKHPMFPRVYHRFVDDIFVIQNGRRFKLVQTLFEDTMDQIKPRAVRFTVDRERDKKLPFLDVMVENVNGIVEVDVYRKPSSTKRLIPSDSFHDMKHKMAPYHSMAHFMCSLPLSDEKVIEETRKIVEIGGVNGYSESTILRIIKKHQAKKTLRELSTLECGNEKEPKVRVGVRFYPAVTEKLKQTYAAHDLELVHRNEGSLKQLLGSIKDTPPDLHKSGIYCIQCGHCGRLYFGMTIRKLFIRFNEHVNSARWKTKTAVGKHIFGTSEHNVNISELRLVQEVRQLWKIEYYEAIHIHKNKHQNLLNVNLGDIKSPLLKLFTLKRVTDNNTIDLTDETQSEGSDDEYVDCV